MAHSEPDAPAQRQRNPRRRGVSALASESNARSTLLNEICCRAQRSDAMNSDFDRQHSESIEPAASTSAAIESNSRVQDRRKFLFRLSIAINAAIGLLVATPVVRFLLGPLRPKGSYDHWIPLGKI